MNADKNGKWVETLDISEELWKRIMQETLNGIVKLLGSVEKLMHNDGDEAGSNRSADNASIRRVEFHNRRRILGRRDPRNRGGHSGTCQKIVVWSRRDTAFSVHQSSC